MDRNEKIDYITARMMEARGFPKHGPNWEVEWDPTRNDSQISMVIEDVEMMLESLDDINLTERLEDRLASLTGGTGQYLTGDQIYNTYNFSPERPGKHAKPADVTPLPNVLTFAQITHQLSDEPTISELREYIAKLDLLELPDDYVLHGWLAAVIHIEDALVERYTDDEGFERVRAYSVVPRPSSYDS